MSTTATIAAEPVLTRRSLLQLGRSTIGFALAKSTVLIAPLLLTRTMNMRDYGLLEYVIAWGTPLTVVCGLGLYGAIPYFLVKRARPKFEQVFNVYTILMGALMLVFTAVRHAHALSLAQYMIGLITAVSVMQGIYATLYKVHSAPVRASLAESGLYVVLLFLALSLFAFKTDRPLLWVIFVLNVFGAIMVAGAVKKYHREISIRNTFRRFCKALGFGMPLILSSTLLGFVTSGGRMLAGHFFSMEVVGVYSLFFRLSAIILVVYQLITTVYFRTMYEATGEILDRYFTGGLGLMLALSVASILIGPLVLARLFPKYWYYQRDSLALYLVLGMQMVLWCGVSMLELVVFRERQGVKLLGVLLISLLFLAVAAGVYLHFGTLTLLRLCQIHMLTIFICLQGQILLLRQVGIKLKLMAEASFASVGLYFLTEGVLHFLTRA
jgi:O-antigen/teichoic acid export membrane protein